MKLRIISRDTTDSMLQKTFLYDIKIYFETFSNFVDRNMLKLYFN